LATGEAVVQRDFAKGTYRVLPTSSFSVSDADGSIFDSDGDTWIRQDTNSHALREAVMRGRELNRQTARRIAAALRKGAK